MQEEHFYTCMKNMFTSPKQNVLTLPCEIETSYFTLLLPRDAMLARY